MAYRSFLAGLNSVSTQTTYANNGKTTILGRAFQKTINSQTVIGPALTQFIDVQTLVGIVPQYSYFNPSTNHLFVMNGSLQSPTIALFNFNNLTGAYSYVGKVIMTLGPATNTNTTKGFTVYETGGAIIPVVSIVSTTAATFGGTYIGWGLTTADFTIGGTTIWCANSTGQKATYLLEDPAALGVNHVATTSWGVSLPQFSSAGTVNTKVWQWNGTLALPVLYSWDLSVSPAVTGTVTNAVTASSVSYTNTSPAAYFTMSGTNNYSSTAGDMVVLTGSTPTVGAIVAWTPGTAQTTGTTQSFMRDLQTLYTVTCTALTSGISANSTYTNNGNTYTVVTAASASATTFVMSGPGLATPTAGGTLVRTSGTGDASITFSTAVQGSSYFNLSLTSGGAAVPVTVGASNFTMLRAFGISSNGFNLKTGTLPAFTLGSIIQADSVGYAKPVSAPANTSLNGQDCLYMATNAGLYMGKISDLTSLGTTWASMNFSGVNITGTGMDVVAPSGSLYAYSGQNSAFDIDKFVYVTNTSTYIMKPYQASNITEIFGGITDTYYETLNPTTVQMGATALNGINVMGGWLFSCSSGIGQRGIVFGDLYSDAQFGNTGVISPVTYVQPGSIFKEIDTIEQLFNYTDSLNFWIRSATTSTDATFSSGTLPVGSPIASGTTSNGWTNIQTSTDLTTIGIGPYFQLCVTFQIATLLANTPAQLNDLKYAVVTPLDSSDYWEGSVDNTTQNGATPAYTAFRMTQAYGAAYSSIVPTLYFRAYDDNGNLVASANTSSNPTLFQYTTNNGTSWASLGTIPNTALTTELRYVWATPPGVRVTCSIRES